MDINKRVSELIHTLRLSAKDFSAEIGISSSALSGFTTGRTTPSFETLAAILNRYPALQARWLMTGEGEMWETPPAAPSYVQKESGLEATEPAAKLVYPPTAAVATGVLEGLMLAYSEIITLRAENARMKEEIIYLRTLINPKND